MKDRCAEHNKSGSEARPSGERPQASWHLPHFTVAGLAGLPPSFQVGEGAVGEGGSPAFKAGDLGSR